VSAAAIVETLAKEFSVEEAHAQRVFELLSAGYKAPYITRYRRSEIGGFTDGTVRRFARRLKQFEELEKRRGALLRSIEEQSRGGNSAPDSLDALRTCMERFELEDLFLPHRRPEPEVQLAIDRGLEGLADALVAPAARDALPEEEEAASEAPAPDEPLAATPPAMAEVTAPAEPIAHEPESTEPSEPAFAEEPIALETAIDTAEPTAEAHEVHEPIEMPEASHDATATHEEHESHEPEPAAPRPAFHPARIDLSPQLARLCAQYVNTDRGVHTEEQALEGAMRILSDRLGRNPELRTQLRRLLRRHGRVGVRPLVDEGRLGRNRSLLRLNLPLKQLQGHRLIALRQAQAQRLVALLIGVDEAHVLPKVRATLGRRVHPDYESVADEVARQALYLRLLPMIEDDVRNELRERADEEAIRMLAQHLRQVLLTAAAGPRPAAGMHVDAKGDWVIVVVGPEGEPQGEEIRVEASTLEAADLAKRLGEALGNSGVHSMAIGHGKASRPALQRLRKAIQDLGGDACVFLVSEAGVSSYANSEIARAELPTWSVPAREAISLARRYQDPLQEFLKVDPRHLGLGREQSVLGKASLRRLIHDTIESCVAHVGCDLNRASVTFLRHVPGLNFELARKLVERRNERPFGSREELRTENLLDDVTWSNAIGFLRVRDSSEPLDRTSLHPEQYDVARRVILQGGGSVEETLGQREATKGLKRADFGIDEGTWRDLVREIGFPGRDPRPRQYVPRFLPPDADTRQLQKDQVVEGVVSNVASFGAFVDLGTERDAMIHISEISSHYVRDARALLSVGQVVRARVVDASGPRVELSLKNVPDFRRSAERGRRHEGAEAAGERRERRPRRPREGGEPWPDFQPVMRAARSRRDGMVTGRSDERRKGGGRGGGRDSSRPAGRPGGRQRGNGGPEEHYDPEAVRRASRTPGYNPFATFFKGQRDPEAPPSTTGPESGATP